MARTPYKRDETETYHKEDCKMAFGKKDMTCPRCKELASGAEPRTSWGYDAKTKFRS